MNPHDRPDTAGPNSIEDALCRLWAEVLGVPTVGAGDDFHALGGGSLHAIRIMLRVMDEHCPDFSPSAAFRLSTPRELARALDDLRSVREALAPPTAGDAGMEEDWL